MLDRTIAPAIQTIDRFDFAWPKTYQLKEGVPLFVLGLGNQPIIKLELVFDAGSWYEPHNGVAYFTAKMLQEGTQYKSAQAIAQYIDRYGASLQVQVQPDTCTFTLITLSNHLTPMVALLAELLLELERHGVGRSPHETLGDVVRMSRNAELSPELVAQVEHYAGAYNAHRFGEAPVPDPSSLLEALRARD